jgi:hypothetical protein
MAEFRGSKNLHLGAGSDKNGNPTPAWAASEYDADKREYVLTLSDADSAKFRALSDEHKYGFREVEAPAENPDN